MKGAVPKFDGISRQAKVHSHHRFSCQVSLNGANDLNAPINDAHPNLHISEAKALAASPVILPLVARARVLMADSSVFIDAT